MNAQQLPPELAELANSLHKKLTEPVFRADRAPIRLDTALESSCRQEAHNIWLEAGFQAWYAWFCVDSNTKATLAELSSLHLSEIASFVCSIRPHETIQNLFEHLFYKSFRGDLRRRILASRGYSYPVPKETTSTVPAISLVPLQTPGNLTPAYGHRQPSIVNDDNAPQPNTSGQPDNNQPDESRGQPVTHDTDSPNDASQPPAVDYNERSFPGAKYLPAIFPPQTCVAIVKTGRAASVRIVALPPALQYSLELDIYASKVPYMARELFGVIIQVEDGRLYLGLDSGANASFDTLRLAGADHEAARRILGRVYSAPWK
ncbi:hypothetical protein VM1G_12025 [Cytospora mali]|uniref:Uncharacterized protein n=1 Tax=Cytospora mali TaxID=578113 RepID=A0A194VI79_CYTMA|nr:hypothetical protein VM1G_12025 [Valsa mali]